MRRSLAFATATLFVFAMSMTSAAGVSTPRFDPAQNVRRVTHALVTTLIWAGYAAKGARHDFASIQASWQQPAATCAGGETSYSSFWVGLDGYNSHSVEQIGTDSDCVNGSGNYYAWYEMYPKSPVLLGSVSPNDSITASVSYAAGVFTLSITGFGPVSQVSNGAARSSAEVIAEAPSSGRGPFSTLPLTDFGTVSFTSATANGSAFANSSPDEIIMKIGSTVRAQVLSTLSSDSFSVKWYHA